MSNRNYPMGSLELWLETEAEIENMRCKKKAKRKTKLSVVVIPKISVCLF